MWPPNSLSEPCLQETRKTRVGLLYLSGRVWGGDAGPVLGAKNAEKGLCKPEWNAVLASKRACYSTSAKHASPGATAKPWNEAAEHGCYSLWETSDLNMAQDF